MLVYLGWRTGQLSAYLLLARGNDMTYCSRMAWRIVVQIFFESLELLALDAVRSYLYNPVLTMTQYVKVNRYRGFSNGNGRIAVKQ